MTTASAMPPTTSPLSLPALAPSHAPTVSGLVQTLAVPVLRAWLLVGAEGIGTMPRASDTPHVRAAGLDPDRILLVGGGLSVGWGVARHDLGVPGLLARALSAATGRGADVDVLTDPGLTVRTTNALLRDVELQNYDAIVVTLGVEDAVRGLSTRVWQRHLRSVLQTLRSRTSARSRIFVAEVQPIRSIPVFDSSLGALADARADRFNRASRAAAADVRGVDVVALPWHESLTPGPRGRTPKNYDRWARLLATAISPVLDALNRGGDTGTARAFRNGEQDEARRQQALDRLGVLDSDAEPRFDRIVAQARAVFGTRYAAVSLVDGEREWVKASAGLARTESPRSQSFCAQTIRSGRPLVVGDASADERFAGYPNVLPANGIRFYAGFPLESPDGYRVGALCVFDTVPRSPEGVDLSLLRELAAMAQAELWRETEGARP